MDDHFADLGFDDIAEQYWGKARRKTCEDVGKLDPALSVGRRADSALSLEAHQSYWGHDEGFILSHMNVVGQATGRARNKRASATTTTSCKCDICCNNKWKPKISHSSFGRSDQTPRQYVHPNHRAGLADIHSSTVTLDSYKVKDELDLEIVDSNKTSGQAKTYLKVKVLKLLGTPWRSGCVMLCECLESPKAFQVGKHYVLKIVDHRLLQSQRSHVHGLCEPTLHTYQRYADMALNGTADEFLNSSFPLASLSHDKEFELHAHTYEPWQAEAGFHRICEVMVQEEMVAYHHLKHLQGTYIPDLIYEIRTCPWFAKLGETPFEHYFQSPGFLLECVDGVALNEISKVPRFFWEEIYQEAVRTANILAYYGFDHKSLAPRNLIVKHQRAPNGRVRVVFIDLHKHGLWSEEDGYFKYDIRWHNDMEEGLFWRSECGDSNPNEEDISRVQWYRKMWHQRIFTGRFGEKSLFNYPEKWEREEDGREPDADTIRNCIKYRIIMDDLWHIEDKTLIDTMVHVKGQVSRIAAENHRGGSRTTRSIL